MLLCFKSEIFQHSSELWVCDFEGKPLNMWVICSCIWSELIKVSVLFINLFRYYDYRPGFIPTNHLTPPWKCCFVLRTGRTQGKRTKKYSHIFQSSHTQAWHSASLINWLSLLSINSFETFSWLHRCEGKLKEFGGLNSLSWNWKYIRSSTNGKLLRLKIFFSIVEKATESSVSILLFFFSAYVLKLTFYQSL